MSDVPKGYKQTEVGVIPEDWEVETIGTLAHVTTGGRNTQDRVKDGLYPFFVRSQTVERINSYSYDGEAVLTAGDGVGTGKVFHYIRGKFDVHQRVYRISEFSNEVDGRYFYLYFSNNFLERIMQMTAKSSVDSVRMDMITKMSIPLPPLPEQRAIASALADVDALLASLEELLTKKRQLKQAAMQELLTGRTRLEGFEGEWAVKQLSDVADVIDPHPSHRAPDEYPNGVPFVGIGDLDESGKLTNTKVRRIHPIILKEHAERYNFADGLIGLGRVASIGKVVKFPKLGEPFAISPTLGVIRGRQAITDFLFYILKSEYISEQFGKIMSGSTRASVGMEVLRKLVIKLPVFPEQQAIASILSDMDAEIDALDERLGKTRALKQGMMQELLTGRTRLI